MHLSSLHLNRESRHVRIDLSDRYSLHQTLAHATLPGERVLWRAEGSTVLVLSPTAPRWTVLNERSPGYLLAEHTREYDVAPGVGRVLAFRMEANATLRHTGPDGRNRRYALRGDESLLGWLRWQGDKHGFEVLEADLAFTRSDRSRRGNQTITLGVTGFEGLLRVTNTEALVTALRGGLGHGRALGLGLLSVARP